MRSAGMFDFSIIGVISIIINNNNNNNNNNGIFIMT